MTKTEYTKLLAKYKNKGAQFAQLKTFYIDAYDNAKQLSEEAKTRCIQALLNYAKNYGVK